MKLIIALIGRPNVGKSTLFNVLTKKRDALVGNHPRLTRDKKYGYANYNGIDYIIIDTGGIDGHEKLIEKKVFEHSFLAIKESNIVFFITDARIGLTFEDIFISENLRNLKKKIFIIINKIEGINPEIAKNEFYKLGLKNIYTISATNGLGITHLMKSVLSKQNENIKTDLITKKNNFIKEKIKIAFIGNKNTGKSTLINKFIKKDFLLSGEIPGITRENIYVPYKYINHNTLLIDTAGFLKKIKKNNKIENLSKQKIFQAISESDIIIFLIDVNLVISNSDLVMINLLLKKGKFFVIVINKCDLINLKKLKKLKDFLYYRLNFIKFIPIYFISTNYVDQVNKLFKSVINHYIKKNKKISTNSLNKILKIAIDKYPHPLIYGREIKLKYVHIGSYNPYIIIIHGNKIHYLSKQYKSYLTNFFYKHLNIKGTAIKLCFKDNINPYVPKNKF